VERSLVDVRVEMAEREPMTAHDAWLGVLVTSVQRVTVRVCVESVFQRASLRSSRIAEAA
jgi:hypothetical protein